MTLWLDAQLPPQLAGWIEANLQMKAVAVRDLGLRDSSDREIFEAAREANAILISKDSDFVELVLGRGSPPKLIWITCGNVSNANLQISCNSKLREAIKLLEGGDDIVELA